MQRSVGEKRDWECGFSVVKGAARLAGQAGARTTAHPYLWRHHPPGRGYLAPACFDVSVQRRIGLFALCGWPGICGFIRPGCVLRSSALDRYAHKQSAVYYWFLIHLDYIRGRSVETVWLDLIVKQLAGLNCWNSGSVAANGLSVALCW